MCRCCQATAAAVAAAAADDDDDDAELDLSSRGWPVDGRRPHMSSCNESHGPRDASRTTLDSHCHSTTITPDHLSTNTARTIPTTTSSRQIK